MKKILLFVFICFTSLTFAQEINMEEAMKMAQPGPEHQLLQKMTGKFKQKIKFNYAPGQSMEGDGTGTVESILGGRFVQISSEGTIMGMKTKSITILGFDRRKSKYTLYSIDEMGTYSVSAEGDYDANTKTMTLTGTEEDPTMKMKQDFKFIFNFVNDNERKMDIVFIKPDGSENKMVEVTITRE